MLWGIRPVEQQAAHGLAVAALRRQIHLGLLLPGDRLPAERKLAEEMNVSRVTLREALRVLEEESYVAIRRGAHGGAFVADAESLDALALRRIGRDPGLFMRVLEFREANERLAARCAAVRRTPADLKHLRAALRAIGEADAAAPLRRAETLFAMALAGAAHNPLLARALEDALDASFAPLMRPPLEQARASAARLRSAILEAVAARLPDTAETAAAELLSWSVAALEGLPKVA